MAIIGARLAAAAAALGCILQSTGLTGAEPVENFFAGKTIKLYVSASAGGTYDLAGRLFVKHFQNHVPGNPTVIVLNMPGTIGLPNWLYNVAEKDGTILGLPNFGVAMNQAIKEQNVR